MRPISRTIVLVTLVLGLGGPTGGCAHRGGGGPDAKPAIAIQRGSSWSSLSVDLPHITGPTGQLKLENGELSGVVGAGVLQVKIEGDRAEGFGPSGPVQMSVTREGDALKVDGMWNGGPVHLTVGPGGLRASVIRRGSRFAAGQASCAYTLDKVDASGAIVGSSICAGMPQETRLEIDPRVRAALGPTELSVLLVALLSTPPSGGPSETIGG
jgi:hypothetical protein